MKTLQYTTGIDISKQRNQMNAQSTSGEPGRPFHAAGADPHHQPLCAAFSMVHRDDSSISPSCTSSGSGLQAASCTLRVLCFLDLWSAAWMGSRARLAVMPAAVRPMQGRTERGSKSPRAALPDYSDRWCASEVLHTPLTRVKVTCQSCHADYCQHDSAPRS
jgi:hypothetical protein